MLIKKYTAFNCILILIFIGYLFFNINIQAQVLNLSDSSDSILRWNAFNAGNQLQCTLKRYQLLGQTNEIIRQKDSKVEYYTSVLKELNSKYDRLIESSSFDLANNTAQSIQKVQVQLEKVLKMYNIGISQVRQAIQESREQVCDLNRIEVIEGKVANLSKNIQTIDTDIKRSVTRTFESVSQAFQDKSDSSESSIAQSSEEQSSQNQSQRPSNLPNENLNRQSSSRSSSRSQRTNNIIELPDNLPASSSQVSVDSSPAPTPSSSSSSSNSLEANSNNTTNTDGGVGVSPSNVSSPSEG